jgi:Icc-related predicted phosphoesterase
MVPTADAVATTSRIPFSSSDLRALLRLGRGSERCWKKFLRAAPFYQAEASIMGGDLTGKAIVPIAQGDDGGFEAEFLGERRAGQSASDLDDLIGAIRYNGMYPWLAPREEIDRVRDDAGARDALFEEVIVDELQRWIDLADDRIGEQDVALFVMAGNDDPWSCDAVLRAARRVVFCDDRVVHAGPHEMISCAYANPTPWHSPRELNEDELYSRIRRLAEQLENPHSAIFNLHVPPFDSGLDRANEIREDLSVVFVGGQPHEIPVGSTAVREIIEEYQPLLSLHGHIHESRGAAQIGRTLAINSGSEYNSGRIHGVTVKLTTERVVSHQFVVG